MQPHKWQPTRLPCPWDSPGKNTGVGCHFLLQCIKVKSESEVAQSCPTLWDPMDCSLPGSSIHGIFQARVLEWGAIAFSVSMHSSCYFSGCPFFPVMDLKLQMLPMFLRISFIVRKKHTGVRTNSICIILDLIISCLFIFKNTPAAEREAGVWTQRIWS